MLVEISFELKSDADGVINGLLTKACLAAGFQKNHFDDKQLKTDLDITNKSAAAKQIYDKFLHIAQTVANENNIVIHVASMVIIVDLVARSMKPGEIITYAHTEMHKNIIIKPDL